ncbi:hypothetical protein BpHYR1_051972 [Brachionus plicatilis]|uniref:Uncharacterized protein n=1 Tax=Brachionus plicatilis TaxID=10195 RepID=A0A3M7SD72_BRAPC|nr:hypothetical protein BpHYR1_051972 [Brachionus plicatilis]
MKVRSSRHLLYELRHKNSISDASINEKSETICPYRHIYLLNRVIRQMEQTSRANWTFEKITKNIIIIY